MFHQLSEIKVMRKKLGLTQSELANYASVSQSLIAKIEASVIDPTYSKTQKIFNALHELSAKDELKAKDVFKKNVVFVKPNDKLKLVVSKMKKQGISQLPVIDGQNVVGLVSEAIILDAVLDNKLSDALVKDVMKDAPPVITKDASVEVISNLLRFYPIILVAEKGRILGLITKSDLLGVL
jgi:predicted transcriptional regulator